MIRRIGWSDYVSKDNPPILILHGTHDALVPYAQSTEFVAALKNETVTHHGTYWNVDDSMIVPF